MSHRDYVKPFLKSEYSSSLIRLWLDKARKHGFDLLLEAHANCMIA